MSPPSDALPLPPIIKRPTSPSISNSALRSPVFAPDPPSPQPASSFTTPLLPSAQHYFSPQPQSSPSGMIAPTPGGILRNKGENPQALLAGRVSPGIDFQQQQHGLGGHRIASPDGSTSESGLSSSSVGFSASAESASTAPSSAVGSPPAPSKHILPTLLPAPVISPGERAQSPPSPHCHFAPLPKVDNDARPGTRRNSFASGGSNRVKPFRGQPERSDAMMSSGSAADMDLESPFSPTSPLSPTAQVQPDSSVSASALSQRLSTSLTFAAPPPTSSNSSPSRPMSRRSSSSRRSRSPSPPPGVARSSSRGVSRSHSPGLSRHASTDALSLHYIEAGAERDASTDRKAGAALSRTSSRAGSERDGNVGAPSGESRSLSVERSRSNSNSPFFLASAALGAAVAGGNKADEARDRDKEADLHRLQARAEGGNEDAQRAVSPALAAQAMRERSASQGAQEAELPVGLRPEGAKRKASNEEVVEIAPGEEGNDGGVGELEEVEEEPEEEEETEGASADEEENEGNEEEDEDEEEEEDGNEGVEDEQELEDEEEEEEEDEPPEERKTAKGAAVEVVRWHRPERDREDPAPVPGAQIPRPAAPPVPGAGTGGAVVAPPVALVEEVAH
ncbi:hypothetical protein JCM11641_000265 [Rhodosporidiobolus odoratus]